MTVHTERPVERPSEKALDALIALGLATPEQVAEAVRDAEDRQMKPLQVLYERRVVSEKDIIRATCQAAGLRFYDLADFQVNPGAASRITGDYARKYNVLPLSFEGERLVIAVSHSQAGNLILRDDLARVAAAPVEFVVAMKDDITERITAVYRAEGELSDLTADMAEDEFDSDVAALGEVAEDAPVVRFVNLLISQAINDGASDIHLDPGEHNLRVRYRIDGVLKEATTAPKSIQSGLISRIKIMAEIDIATRRIPQDGRMSINHNGRKIDLRVSTIPLIWGAEKVVLRILDNSTAKMSLDDLGFSPENFARYETAFTKPYGMVLVTGPTGSGKSTTLYATMNIVSNPQVNVITVEDPVEYKVAGINQVQTNNKAGLTFATVLKSILRADPDVILVGEIRDRETANIAVEAALTGHMVFSTLHTTDAPSAITRLIEMGIEPFLVGSAVDAVLAQRLCRRLCLRCREAYTPTETELMSLDRFPWEPGQDIPTLYRASDGGCAQCSETGFKGRMGLHEVMPVTEDIERLAVARASSDEIKRMAVSQGMRTLVEDGWLRVLDGHTSIQEVLRVVV